MSLPFTRNTNYGPGSIVKSVDLDDIQDCIIAAKHGELWVPLGASAGSYDNCSYLNSAGYVSNTGSPWSTIVPVHVFPGTRVKNARVLRKGDGSSTLTVTLRKVTFDTSPSVTTVKSASITSPSSTWTATDLGMTSSDWLTTSRTVVLHLYVNGAGPAGTQAWGFPEVLIDRP